MEGNMLKPIVDCVWDVCEIIMKYTKKITSNTTNYNGQDFKKFFKGIGLKNNEEKYPSLISRKYEGIYNIYTGCEIGNDYVELDFELSAADIVVYTALDYLPFVALLVFA